MWTVTEPDTTEFDHYGVKGMKWGVRKEYEPKGRKSSSLNKLTTRLGDGSYQYVVGDTKRIKDAKNSKVTIEADLPNIHEFIPRTIKTDSGTTKIIEFDDMYRLLGPAMVSAGIGKTGEYAPKDVAKQRFDNLPKINEYKSEEIEQWLVNRNAPTQDRLSNCYECCMAYEMRQRGYDVQANNRQGGTFLEVIHSFRPKDMFVMDSSSTDEAFKQLEAMCLEYGEGARGMLGLSWPSGGGHAINWEVKDGEFILLDNQKMGRDGRDEFSMCDPSHVQVVRLDNAEVLPGVTDFIENSEGYNGELDPEEDEETNGVEDLASKSKLRKDVEKYLEREKNKEEHAKRVADAINKQSTKNKGKKTISETLKTIGNSIVKTASKAIEKGKKIVNDILSAVKEFAKDPLDKSGKRKAKKIAKKKAKEESRRKRKEAWDNDPRSTFDKIFNIREVSTTTNYTRGKYR